jgi:RnfABCDGE-type electron transport complex B subunit
MNGVLTRRFLTRRMLGMVVVYSVIVLGALGLLLGLGLAVANRVFHVETDPRVELVNAALPQVNCGACNCAGCMEYALAVAGGTVAINLCIPGASETARNIARIMGREFVETEPVRAYVHCQGGRAEAKEQFQYRGQQDCRAAVLVQGGPKSCKYGCLGFGTCMKVCPFDAVTISENRLPVIDRDKCTGCGACVKACPVRIIDLLSPGTEVILACSNRDRGAAVKKICSVGCISCTLCAKATPGGKITMEKGEALPTVHYDVEEGSFDKAIEKCPMNCYVKLGVREETLAAK